MREFLEDGLDQLARAAGHGSEEHDCGAVRLQEPVQRGSARADVDRQRWSCQVRESGGGMLRQMQVRVRGRRPRLARAQQDWVPGEAEALRLGLDDGTLRL